MEVERLTDPALFRGAAEPFLLENEAANNLILGVSGTAARNPDHFGEFIGWLLRSGSFIVAVAAQTPPHNLILAAPAPDAALRHLVRELGDLPGVIGTRPDVDIFVQEWGPASRTMRQGIYRLSVVRIPIKPGFRRATPDDRALLIDWIYRFQDEATLGSPDRAQGERALDRRLDADENEAGMWVLEVDDEPVSISGYANPTPHGIRIGPVYTPPEHRGRDFATDLVAAQSHWLLNRGFDFVFLYTDLDNPTSNSIYQTIGYEMIAESTEYSFSPSP